MGLPVDSLAELFQDFGAGGGFVASVLRPICFSNGSIISGGSVRVNRKSLIGARPRHFPVAGSGVFAGE